MCESPDPVYVLAFAAIMLHTDAHSANVKKKMTKQEWLKNNRGLNAGKDLPEDFLLDLYQRITTDEMKMLKEVRDPLTFQLLSQIEWHM